MKSVHGSSWSTCQWRVPGRGRVTRPSGRQAGRQAGRQNQPETSAAGNGKEQNLVLRSHNNVTHTLQHSPVRTKYMADGETQAAQGSGSSVMRGRGGGV